MIYIITTNSDYHKQNTETPATAKRFTVEEWQELIIKTTESTKTTGDFHKQIKFMLKDFKSVHIDNIDFLKNCPTIQEVTAEIIIVLSENIDFYLSGIKLDERIAVIFDVFEKKRVKFCRMSLSKKQELESCSGIEALKKISSGPFSPVYTHDTDY